MSTTTNLTNASVLIRDDVTTLEAAHTQWPNSDPEAKTYTYKVTNALADQLKPGDMALVRNKYGIKTVEVVKVHDTPMVDLDVGYTYAWAFARIPLEEAKRLSVEEETLVDRLNAQRKRGLRAQMLNALGVTQDEVRQLLHMDLNPGDPNA